MKTEKYGLTQLKDSLTIDVVWRHEEYWKLDTVYRSPMQLDWVSVDPIPVVPNEIRLLDRRNVGWGDLVEYREDAFAEVDVLWDSDSDSAYLPAGFWKFRVFIEMTHPDSGRPFSVSRESHFRITET